MSKKLHIKKGDTVVVISGSEKNKQGKVLEVQASKERAIVEGVNLKTRHTKPNAQHPDGGRIESEASIHISNLSVVDPKTGKPTRIGRRKNEEGKSVRYAKKSGEELK